MGKIKKELGWEPKITFEEGIRLTVRWYLENEGWLQNVKRSMGENDTR